MQYAVIQTGGKQYKVTPGMVLEVDRLKGVKNGEVSFDKVLLTVEDGEFKLGNPYILNLVVNAKVLGEVRGEKLRVSKFKAKSKYRKTIGFRADYTKVQIEGIKEIKEKKS